MLNVASLAATTTHTAKVLPSSKDVQQLAVDRAVCVTKPLSVELRGRRKVLVTLRRKERCAHSIRTLQWLAFCPFLLMFNTFKYTHMYKEDGVL